MYLPTTKVISLVIVIVDFHTHSLASDGALEPSDLLLQAKDAEEDVKKDMSQKGEQEHTGHYTCWNCNESLSGQRYIIRDDNSYCIKCYEELFANTCEACSQKIGTDSKVRNLT